MRGCISYIAGSRRLGLTGTHGRTLELFSVTETIITNGIPHRSLLSVSVTISLTGQVPKRT